MWVLYLVLVHWPGQFHLFGVSYLHYISQCLTFAFLLTVVVSYEISGRHTVIPMAITAGFALVLLILLAVFYKNLATKQEKMDLTVNATSQLTPTEQYSAGL